MAKHYAWSDIHNGGEVEHVKLPNGDTKQVVTKRNITRRGEEVSQAKLGVSKEEFAHLVSSGSVRAYPLPKGADENVSPSSAMLTQLLAGNEEIDQNMLLELALKQPDPSADAEADQPVGV